MLTHSDGENERILLAASNSNLRSDLLKLNQEHDVALAEIQSLTHSLSELEVLLDAVDRQRVELATDVKALTNTLRRIVNANPGELEAAIHEGRLLLH